MKKYECEVCGYIYDPAVGDPEHNIAPGTLMVLNDELKDKLRALK